MSATAVNPYKQQSTLRSGGDSDVKEETLHTDDGRWTMDDGGPQLQLTTQQSNSAWETEDGGSDERQRILQLIWRDYDWEKEEGLHLPCKSEGEMPQRPL